jgi:hypothetical protein
VAEGGGLDRFRIGVSFAIRRAGGKECYFKFGRVRLVVGITPRGPVCSFTHLLDRHMSGTFSIRGIGTRGGIDRGFSTLGHRDTLRMTCMILLCRDGVLHPFIALSFGTLFSFVALPRFNTSAFCALGDRISDGSTLGGDQWDPGHVNLVALLHERRLEPPQWDGEPEGGTQHVPRDEVLSKRQQKNTVTSSKIKGG